jgi:DNA-binding LacI/PurR family transcriptional regulator
VRIADGGPGSRARITAETGLNDVTVKRYLSGEPVMPGTRTRIEATMERLGIAAPPS